MSLSHGCVILSLSRSRPILSLSHSCLILSLAVADGAGADPGGVPLPAGQAGGEAEEAAGAGDPGPRGARAAGRLVSTPIGF